MDEQLPLPLEIWRYLDVTSLCAASLVCHSWHALSSDNLLWKEACVREITSVEWTPRMLARPHKSWKRHFGVRLRASDSIESSVNRVVPRLLADAHERGHESSPKRRMAVMALNSSLGLAEEASSLGLDCVNADAIQAFKKDKKKIKQWARRYSCLIVDPGLIRMIPRMMGPQLNKMGKFPMPLPDDTPLATVVKDQLRTVKFQMRRSRPDAAVGNVSMSAQELIDNVLFLVNSLLAELPSRDRLKAIQLHATRGPVFKVYSRPSAKAVTDIPILS